MDPEPAPRLSVIIPAYNEAPRLPATLAKLADYFARAPYAAEVIVVDDGSTDDTTQVATAQQREGFRLRVLSYQPNRGKGHAVRFGMEHATGAVRLFFDADGSTPIDQVEKLWPHIAAGAEVCVGSRGLPESDIVVRQPWRRQLMGRVFNWLVRALAVRGFRDTQCGFKAFTARAAELIFSRQRLTGFGFDVELLFIAQWHGLRAVEVPVQWIDSPSSRVDPWRDARRMFFEILQIRRLARGGAYQ
jgi:dolichyl-phosphate beta-glucosyltransferase